MPEHSVVQGECILSIAAHHGFSWKTIWDDPANKTLRGQRKHPTILKPGDIVQIPERGGRQADRPTDAKHRFRRKATPAKLRLRLLRNGQPLADTDYIISTDGPKADFVSSSTDADGRLEWDVDPSITLVRLQIGTSTEEHVLKLGWIDPLDSTSGMQARLNNLGFKCGKVDDDMGPNTRRGMNAFQRKKKRKPTREPDQPTRDDIEKDYGC